MVLTFLPFQTSFTTLFMMDRAHYHTKTQVKEVIKALKLPVLFVSPYSPMICPIESLFARIKS